MFGSPALQWSPSNADIITTIAAACLEYGDICISEASGIFLVGVAMCICAVEHAMNPPSRALHCFMLVGRANQRLVLCVPATNALPYPCFLMYVPVLL